MSNILFSYDINSPSAQLLKEALERWNAMCGANARIVYRADGSVSANDFAECDIVVIVRGLTPYERNLVSRAKAAGKFVVLSIDDDMLNPPKDYPMYGSRKRALKEIIEKCDVLLVSNAHLGKKYGAVNEKCRIVRIDTPIEQSDIITHVDNNAQIKVVYAAGGNHETLFESYVLPALKAVKKRNVAPFELTLVGSMPDTSAIEGEIEIKRKQTMPFAEYEQFMREENFDIGLAPIHDTEFCHCKYINKFLSYSKYGVVGIYTNCEPYTEVVEDKVNGLLAQNTVEGWTDALVYALDNADERKKMRANAYEVLKIRFDAKTIAERLNADLSELGSFTAGASAVKYNAKIENLKRRVFKLNNAIYLTLVSLKRKGFVATLAKAKSHKTRIEKYGKIED